MKKGSIPPLLPCVLFCSFIWIALLSGCGDGISTTLPTIGPTAAFTVSASIGSYPLTVSFDAAISTAGDGTITRYDWQFGDGNTGTGAIIQHTYTSTGTYTARLTVLDSNSNTDTKATVIEVKPQYTLSGTVTSADYIETDSDVNDSNAAYTANDSFAQAQEVSTPVSISGYVNLAGSGNFGRSFFTGDTDDYYTATLDQATDINLHMAASPSTSELNLYLYDAGQTVIDATFTDDTGTASLVVPAAGTYSIRVEAADYASLTTATVYALNIGNIGTAAIHRSPRLSDNFVPGEVLVRFGDSDPTFMTGLANGMERLSAMGLSTGSDNPVRDKLWQAAGSAERRNILTNLGVQSALARSLAPGHTNSQNVSKTETLWMVRGLRKSDGVELADPNYIRKQLITEPNDTYYPYQWHYPLIGLPEAWDVTTGNANVIVAVVDSGILSQHPDLQGQIVDGYDFVSNTDRALDGDGIDPDPEDPGDGDIGGSSFHGTHTAGTIAARSNNGVGVAGIAWNAKIMLVRALGLNGSGTTADILESVRYAAGMATDAGIQNPLPADVINLSLGGSGYSQIEEQVYQEVHNRGIVVVASAGNDGTMSTIYPAGYDGVVAVSAVTIDGGLADYSNFGATIDVAAPGGSSTDLNGDGYVDGVLSTVGDDSSGTIQMRYAFYTGTSMAAPHVAGVAALMKSIYPAMTASDFDTLLTGGYLTQSSSNLLPNDRLGYGIIDAYKAVLVAEESDRNGGIPPILSVAPRTLNFGVLVSSLDITVDNGGSGVLSVDSYVSDAAWLSVEPSMDVDASGFGTYNASVDRNGLTDGTYKATITFTAGTQEVRISVIMQVGFSTSTSGGGYHYILLINPNTQMTVDEVPTEGIDGSYAYDFTGLSYGDTYVIYAGTDPNNDLSICTEGETCGAYLSLDKPVILTIQDNMENIDFTTNINITIPDAAAGVQSESGISVQRKSERILSR
ncbi:MAG: S8 family serine peptidase [Acidobacteriota bacterium]